MAAAVFWNIEPCKQASMTVKKVTGVFGVIWKFLGVFFAYTVGIMEMIFGWHFVVSPISQPRRNSKDLFTHPELGYPS